MVSLLKKVYFLCLNLVNIAIIIMVIIMKDRNYYLNLLKCQNDYYKMLKNFLLAFLFGGIISIFGEFIYDIYNKILSFNSDESIMLMYISIILISGVLTAIGIYDNLVMIGKSAFSIMITGFANSVTSAGMDYHYEGIVGVLLNVLKLAGSVIVLGSFSAILVSFILYLWSVIV